MRATAPAVTAAETQEPEREEKRPPGSAPFTLTPGAVMSGFHAHGTDIAPPGSLRYGVGAAVIPGNDYGTVCIGRTGQRIVGGSIPENRLPRSETL